MGWYVKVISMYDEFYAQAEAGGLMNEFAIRYRESGVPKNAEVWGGNYDFRGQTYHFLYFSPGAVEIAKDILVKSGATPCGEPPGFDGLKKIGI